MPKGQDFSRKNFACCSVSLHEAVFSYFEAHRSDFITLDKSTLKPWRDELMKKGKIAYSKSSSKPVYTESLRNSNGVICAIVVAASNAWYNLISRRTLCW